MGRAIPANKIVHVIPGKAGGHSSSGSSGGTPTPPPLPPGEGTGTANAVATASATSTATKTAAGSASASGVATGVSSSQVIRQATGSALATASALAIAAAIKTGAGAAVAAAVAAAMGTAAKLAVGSAAAISTAQAVAPAAASYQPTLLASPTVSGASGPGGAPVVGDVLSLTGDTWANQLGTITKSYQWYRGLDLVATTATFAVTSSDIGTNLRGVVIGSNAAGVDWPAYSPFTPYVRSAATATYDIAFGSKTPSGFGGFQVGVGRTISSGNTGGDWTIDDLGDLVPSGTFAAAKTYSASTYLLTLDNAQTVRITMVANRYDVTARYGSASNNDGSITLESQCNFVLNNAVSGLVCVLGDSIYWRNFRIFNPNVGDFRFNMRNTFTGTGRIRIYGAYIAYVSTDFPSDFVAPIDFVNGNFYNNNASSTFGGLLTKANPNVGSGIGVFDSTFLVGPLCNIPGDIYAIKTRGAGDCSRNSFNNCGAGIASIHKNGEENGDYCDNVFTSMQEDCIKGTFHGANQKIWRNFVYNQPFYTGNHPDFVQHTGFTDGLAHNMGSIRFNVAVRNNGTAGQPDFQGVYFGDMVSPATVVGLVVKQNIVLQTLANGILIDYPVNPNIAFNTTLFDYPIGDVGAGTISRITPGSTGTGGSINNNVSNNDVAAAWASQTGATIADNIQLASTSGAYAAALNAFSATGLTTRAAALAAFTPKENGTLKKPNTSYAGALLPPSSGNGTVGCWNSGEAINPMPTGAAVAVTTAQATGAANKAAAGSASAVGVATGVASGPAAITLNPSDKNANITLSNGNLTATLGSVTSGNYLARAQAGVPIANGDWYYEVRPKNTGIAMCSNNWSLTADPTDFAAGRAFGMNNASPSVMYWNGGSSGLSPMNTAGYEYDGTHWFGILVRRTQTTNPGDTIAVFIRGPGGWSTGGGNPYAGGGGHDWSGTFGGGAYVLYPAAWLGDTGDAADFNFGGSAYAYTLGGSPNNIT